ncbi:3-hydroxyisobutyrate dehydrogenase-like beta-hydroxyacid dehydrogenase [Saccharothrix tamanrassetensis]|uniref:3-hydroxyisobutyrate dehydrogenase-like beta-hydroxyacid dehydrogenase n=1 Tax=Saccharothrix tamanrassetensis TaxID=1051531 RepID=A0A841CCH8_9PSEU|nr:NAD(P)-binding domain-containing protein [Saccharothrix tamanrassetensis]MBB5953878.1 3-hydroxyisobutyrate dehydrogenase-like beta-hydroxyacid dehydrogenase [Saccharothrix tamanrassetensis]
MTEASPAPVSVIGLGLMGAALAGAYLKAGHQTTVWNRSAGKADALVAQGATNAEDISEAVAASDVLVVCVFDYAALYSILEPVKDSLRGKVIVNLTSGLPEDARGAAEWAQGVGAEYLDGYIMSVPPGVGQPQTLLFYAGDADVFAKHEATLKVLGGNSVHLGTDPGIAALYDLGLLTILWTSLAGALHAYALVGSEKVPAAALAPYAEAWITHVVLPSVKGAAAAVDSGQYATSVSTTALNAIGLGKLAEASKAAGIRPDLVLPIKEYLEKRVADGHGDEALAGMFEVIRSPE